MNSIPSFVLNIAKTLSDNNFEAYLVGGSLRDILLGRKPKDYDITTNALPDDIMRIFPRSVPTGAKFGTVVVISQDEQGVTQEVEVTTYRSEKDYVGGRWPSHVEFSKNIIDDLKRRDFTINAIALDLITNYELLITRKEIDEDNSQIHRFVDLILDPFEGQKDLEKKFIRAVGNPIERFREDGLRSLRACRLASVLGFEIEEKTFDAIKETIEVPALISKERVRVEIQRLIEESPKPSLGIELMRECGLLNLFIPELLEGYKLEHNKYHVHDVYQHALDTVDIAPKEIRIAALFHDIGKPRCKDGEHFYGHDLVGAEMTREILTRLKFPRQFIEDTANLVRWHMFYLPEGKINNEQLIINNLEDTGDLNDSGRRSSGTSPSGGKVEDFVKKKYERNKAFENGWSDSAIRRLIRNVGGHDQLDNLIKLRIADATANPKSSFNPFAGGLRLLEERVAKIREEESLLSVKDLQITGHDLMEMGVPKGPKIKEVLEYLLERVTDDIELNESEDLIELVKQYLREIKN